MHVDGTTQHVLLEVNRGTERGRVWKEKVLALALWLASEDAQRVLGSVFVTAMVVARNARSREHLRKWISQEWKTGAATTVEDFNFLIDEFDDAPESLVLMILRGSRTFDVDLSSVAVRQALTLGTTAVATAYNRIASAPSESGSSATAFLRDPHGIMFSRLEETDVVSLDARPESRLSVTRDWSRWSRSNMRSTRSRPRVSPVGAPVWRSDL